MGMLDENSLGLLLHIREKGAARFRDLRSIIKNPRTLSIKLRKLRELDIIEEDGGKYKLTQRGIKVSVILEDLNKTLCTQKFKVENIERIPHKYFASLIKRYCEILKDLLGDRLISVMLFGSVARGDWNKNSDIDILIVADDWSGKPVWDRIEELMRAKKVLEESPEFQEALRNGYWPIIQNHPLSMEEAEKFNRIYLDAMLEGIILYDRDGFLSNIIQYFRRRLADMGSYRVTLPDGSSYWVLKDMEAGEVINLG
jgi:predicted nucleotidyltransferase